MGGCACVRGGHGAGDAGGGAGSQRGRVPVSLLSSLAKNSRAIGRALCFLLISLSLCFSLLPSRRALSLSLSFLPLSLSCQAGGIWAAAEARTLRSPTCCSSCVYATSASSRSGPSVAAGTGSIAASAGESDISSLTFHEQSSNMASSRGTAARTPDEPRRASSQPVSAAKGASSCHAARLDGQTQRKR